MSQRRLYVFSPLPPQRNGLGDYIAEYLPFLAQDYQLALVAQSKHYPVVKTHLASMPKLRVIDETQFRAEKPAADGQVLYNIGNNDDCAYMLDYAEAFPGVSIIHDISLFYLHQVAASQARAFHMMGTWLAQSNYTLPSEFFNRNGHIVRTPGVVYQECLLLSHLVQCAKGVMVHTEYAERRMRGGVNGVQLGAEHKRPLARIPHFVLPANIKLTGDQVNQMLQRFTIAPDEFVLLVPGFLTGNKMLYEVLMAYRQIEQRHPDRKLKLLFAGEERPNEYNVSERIRTLWPKGNGPLVTGYLSADELDVLLGRADLSFVLRYPTYGESSGILPRAAMGGGRVVTVDIGAYPEFQSPQIRAIPVGPQSAMALVEAVEEALIQHNPSREARAERCAAETERASSLSPQGLYPKLRQLLDQTWELHA